jgi:hypothetical protein
VSTELCISSLGVDDLADDYYDERFHFCKPPGGEQKQVRMRSSTRLFLLMYLG